MGLPVATGECRRRRRSSEGSEGYIVGFVEEAAAAGSSIIGDAESAGTVGASVVPQVAFLGDSVGAWGGGLKRLS